MTNVETLAEPRYSPLKATLQSLVASPPAIIGLAIFSTIVLIAVFAPLISPQNPYDLMSLDIGSSLMPPGTPTWDGTGVYLLGTDGQGRDILSGIFYGLRISLMVGIGSALAAAIVGSLLGMLAAFKGGRTETVIMRLVDLQLSFPAILVALMILAFLGKGVLNIVLALMIVEWAGYARTARGAALVEMERDYMSAARTAGLSPMRILLVHLLPNAMPPLIVLVTIQVARAISLEATLSFLGLGVPITEPSLGMLIADGFQYILSGKYWITVYPGIALVLTVISINLIGDRLRVVFNPRLQS